MREAEYQRLDGIALAGLLARGEVGPAELMQCAIALARRRAPQVNALCYEQYEASMALAGAAELRGAFGAVPFLLKDSGLASVRFPSSIGSRLFDGTTYARNATLVDRFEQAGLLAFARTAVPELCMAPTTEAVRNGGPTLNPYDHGRSAGGSSGGAAAAVALGIVPLAHGSDGGGSIRIPAACCGVYGLKPTRGRVPMGPFRGEGWGGLACDGVLSRSVRDTAAALDAIAGWEAGAPYASPPGVPSYQAALAQAPARPLRIAVWREAWDGIAVAPECVQAVGEAAALCRALGHEVIDAAPPALDFDAFVRAHLQVLAANIVVAVDARLAALGRGLREDDLEPAILDGHAMGKRLNAGDYVSAINRFHAVGRLFEEAMQPYDLVLTPTLTQLPAPLGHLAMTGGFAAFRERVAQYTTFLAVINASGQPAASVPVCWTPAGLPVGVQLIGHFGCEQTILRLSAELEQAQPWHDRYPPGC